MWTLKVSWQFRDATVRPRDPAALRTACKALLRLSPLSRVGARRLNWSPVRAWHDHLHHHGTICLLSSDASAALRLIMAEATDVGGGVPAGGRMPIGRVL